MKQKLLAACHYTLLFLGVMSGLVMLSHLLSHGSLKPPPPEELRHELTILGEIYLDLKKQGAEAEINEQSFSAMLDRLGVHVVAQGSPEETDAGPSLEDTSGFPGPGEMSVRLEGEDAGGIVVQGTRMPMGQPPFFIRYRHVVLVAGLALTLGFIVLLSRIKRASIREVMSALRLLDRSDRFPQPGKRLVERGGDFALVGRELNNLADRQSMLYEEQKRLLAEVTHEMNAPLARLSMAAEMARQERREAAEQYMQRILGECGRLSELAQQFLVFSRAGSHRDKGNPTTFDLRELLERCVDNIRFEARAKQCSVVCSFIRDPVLMTGDPELVFRAVENALRNAVAHTGRSTIIRCALALETREGTPSVLVRVSDQGPGVPEESLDNIFRPFFRIPGYQPSHGAGLGLAIIRRAATRHDGDAWAENNREGGLTLCMRFPTGQAETLDQIRPSARPAVERKSDDSFGFGAMKSLLRPLGIGKGDLGEARDH